MDVENADLSGSTFRACDLSRLKVVDSLLADVSISGELGRFVVNDVDVTAFVWSFTETLRHLVFATDAWVSRTILDEPMPHHRLGLPQTSYPSPKSLGVGIDVDAQPAPEEVPEVRADRMAVVAGSSRDGRRPNCPASAAPTRARLPDEPSPVSRCLRVVMNEECEHHRYALRELAALETRA